MSALDSQQTLARALLEEISPEELSLVEPYWRDQQRSSDDKDFGTPLEFGSAELFALATPVVYWVVQQLSKVAGDQLQIWLKKCVHWRSGQESRDSSFDELMAELKTRCSEAGLEDNEFVRIQAALFAIMIKKPKLITSILT